MEVKDGRYGRRNSRTEMSVSAAAAITKTTPTMSASTVPASQKPMSMSQLLHRLGTG
jgi:hypothetical protein